VRERVWSALQTAGVSRFPGARHRIPNFTGAETAAQLLATTDAWRDASALKCNPDSPQLPVRATALVDGKLVYMAVPRLRTAEPFLLLDPARLEVAPRAAASIKGSDVHGVPTALHALPHLDLVVCGTVAVNHLGVRIGKGGGYSDLELALAIEAGAVDASTVIATTVHPVQLLDEDLPETDHDFRVDLVVLPDQVIRTPGGHRPRGIIDADLDDERRRNIPVLARS
jgi:5-formyltetrahydrofolate cyclo-ligase